MPGANTFNALGDLEGKLILYDYDKETITASFFQPRV